MTKHFADQTHIQDFHRLLLTRFFMTVGIQILSVGLGWQIYQLTKSPFHLGMIGLSHFLPMFCLSLFSGAFADRFEKKQIITLTQFILFLGAFVLIFHKHIPVSTTVLIYFVAATLGATRAFLAPAAQSFLPSIVSEHDFSKVVAKNSSVWQTAMILGPTVGGFIYAQFGTFEAVYFACCFCMGLGILFLSRIESVSHPTHNSNPNYLREIKEGLKFILHEKIILGAISLDLFAVLLGGATALLPIYANEILHVGAQGLGFLRSAPGLGAALMGLYLSKFPIKKNAGKKMLLCVACFGLLTLGFGLSKNFYLSLLCLFLMGMFDLVSVVIRMSLVQLRTPSHMRGRISSVNQLFISASNELGEFESGLTASWFGTVPAVVIGGLGTLTVAGVWFFIFPKIKEMNTLEKK